MYRLLSYDAEHAPAKLETLYGLLWRLHSVHPREPGTPNVRPAFSVFIPMPSYTRRMFAIYIDRSQKATAVGFQVSRELITKNICARSISELLRADCSIKCTFYLT